MVAEQGHHHSQVPQLEWSSTVRHWWRYEAADHSMIHRASGEKVVFRGLASAETAADARAKSAGTDAVVRSSGVKEWARFDYQFGSESYPLLIEVRRVRYPNAWPERYARAPYNAGVEPETELLVWRVDHIRSAHLWREMRHDQSESEDRSEVPYALWRRADRAIVDASLLWPREFAVLPPADEVAISGGWLNGDWTSDFYRRFYPRDRELFERLASGIPAYCKVVLPLEEYSVELPFDSSPIWENVTDRAVGLHGERLDQSARMLRNRQDGTTIARASGELRYHLWEKAGCLVTVKDNLFVAVFITSSSEVNLLEGSPGGSSGSVNASWNIMLFDRCAIGLIDPAHGSPSFLKKRIRERDSITEPRAFKLIYSDTEVDHPLLSYDLWQWLSEVFVNALPFSQGFETDGDSESPTQGDIGRVYLSGGFIGGIHLLAMELRRKLQLPGDRDRASSWSPFFE